MGEAHRLADPHAHQAPHSRCLGSPHCVLPLAVADHFAGHDGLWLHYGPIGSTRTPLALHRAERALADRNAAHLAVDTRATHRSLPGYRVDWFCVERNPGGGARRLVQQVGASRSVLWRVYGVAWSTRDGLRVRWTAPGLGLPNEGWMQYLGMAKRGAETDEELARLTELLADAGPRRGRPPRWKDPHWRDAAARAQERKDTHPRLPWDDIARAIGINPRTLRDYRRILRREHMLDQELHLVRPPRGGEPG
jgi:hypothetical protein